MSDDETYTTKSGRVLTNADIEALANEAEKGYDIDRIVAEARARAQAHYEAGGSHPQAIHAMLRANARAHDKRMEIDHLPGTLIPRGTIMKGAPTHSCAFLLQALEEDGWRVVPKDHDAVRRVEPGTE